MLHTMMLLNLVFVRVFGSDDSKPVDIFGQIVYLSSIMISFESSFLVTLLGVGLSFVFNSDDDIEKFYEELEEAKTQCSQQNPLIIMGDFNAKVGEGREENIVGPHGLGTRNLRGENSNHGFYKSGLISIPQGFGHLLKGQQKVTRPLQRSLGNILWLRRGVDLDFFNSRLSSVRIKRATIMHPSTVPFGSVDCGIVVELEHYCRSHGVPKDTYFSMAIGLLPFGATSSAGIECVWIY
ncbi:craniofacial development protein 2 [Plakobranchus ocellatus]|uniref:Craniofacial development protein 2 n=1 Tax=Plakobranchus ocellatus TaxID=259542 RepID=A0AAV4ACY0_9GAST|nr:craniofacial development protein 2 [Plakobranchus ocellatus]